VWDAGRGEVAWLVFPLQLVLPDDDPSDGIRARGAMKTRADMGLPCHHSQLLPLLLLATSLAGANTFGAYPPPSACLRDLGSDLLPNLFSQGDSHTERRIAKTAVFSPHLGMPDLSLSLSLPSTPYAQPSASTASRQGWASWRMGQHDCRCDHALATAATDSSASPVPRLMIAASCMLCRMVGGGHGSDVLPTHDTID
jgi:hypothetical protein